MRVVALGDSITAGFGDPIPGGGWRGWAALLAAALAPPGAVHFHNLAHSGALTNDVADRQLPVAQRLRPDVATVVVGINDTLRAGFDADLVGERLDRIVRLLAAAGTVVLTARLPDPGLMLGLPATLARPLSRRIHAVNTAADIVATRYGTVHFDAAAHPATYDRRMWSIDRLHPSERGHRLLACCYADLLGARGMPVYRRPDPEPENPEPTRRAQLWWLATQGTRWVLRRSTDLVPALLGMALADAGRRRFGDGEPAPGHLRGSPALLTPEDLSCRSTRSATASR